MKKTIIALLAMSGAVFGDVTYTLDATSTGSAVMGGSFDGSVTTSSYTPNQGGYANQELTVISGSTYTERGTQVLYDLINSAIEGESILTLSGNISVGTTSSSAVLLHVGRDGTGLTLCVTNGGLYLTNTGVNTNGIKLAELPINNSGDNTLYMTDYSVTLSEGGVVTCSINGAEATTCDGAFTANWYTGTADGGMTQNYMYSFGHRAPGWNGDSLSSSFTTTGLTISSTIPEPATATLSLLALAALAARRRRK